MKYRWIFNLAMAGAVMLQACGTENFSQMEKESKGSYFEAEEVTAPDGVLTPEVLLAMGRLSDPQMSPDGTRILYGVSRISVSQNRSLNNLYICDADGSNALQLTRSGISISNGRWSKDGKSIFFIRGGQVYKAAIKIGEKSAKLGRVKKLTDVAEGVAEFCLSPDECSLMYISTIPGPVKGPKDSDPKLDKANAYVAEGLMYRHWDHWVTETPRTYIAGLGDELITKSNSTDLLSDDEPFELPTEPFGGLEQLSWSPDGKLIAYSCRKKSGIEYAFSTNTEIYIYDTESGETVQVSHNGGYDTDPVWNEDGTMLAWISMERDGYEADRQRIMVAEANGKSISEPRELTSGYAYDAAGLTWLGEDLIFPSTIDGIGALCRVNTHGEAKVERITPAQWQMSFSNPFHIAKNIEGGIDLYTTYMAMAFPTEMVKVSLEANTNEVSYAQIGSVNGGILSTLAAISEEQITIKTPEGENLYCWVLYPEGFDASKSYPVVEMFNGGPQTSLDQSWSYRWNFRMMCQQGYVVLLPNRHGDSGFGQEWKEQISGDYQGLNMQDYMLAAKWARKQAWCGKVAAVGASYGGFSVYNMMGLHEDLFDCFIAHAGIFDEKMMWYTTEEAWFGNWDNGGLTPYAYTKGEQGPKGDGITFGGMQQAGAPYADVAKSRYHYANSPESKVTRWHTPLLCIHGMMDFRIPYEQGMAAFNAAQMMGVPSKLIVFPEENHWIIKPQNALFWHHEFFGWLDQWCK